MGPCVLVADDSREFAEMLRATLEEAGFEVTMPRTHLCCGRPLYDYGMLNLAKRYLRKVLDELRDDIRAGVPLVGVEPSCVAVFKDELVKVWPNDEDAQRLSRQTFHLGEFLAQHAEDWEPPQLHRKAIVHEHCHHHATGGIEPDQKLLERMGVDVEKPESGCCGMAGGWGYEEGHYDVSTACGERVLFPKVREAPTSTLVVADGFSCRSQIEQGRTGRRALHVAQVLGLARRYGPAGPPGEYPERATSGRPEPRPARTAARGAVALGLAAALATVVARPGR